MCMHCWTTSIGWEKVTSVKKKNTACKYVELNNNKLYTIVYIKHHIKKYSDKFHLCNNVKC